MPIESPAVVEPTSTLYVAASGYITEPERVQTSDPLPAEHTTTLLLPSIQRPLPVEEDKPDITKVLSASVVNVISAVDWGEKLIEESSEKVAKGVPVSCKTKSPVPSRSKVKLLAPRLTSVAASKSSVSWNSVKSRISSATEIFISLVGDAVRVKSVLKSRVSTFVPIGVSLVSTFIIALVAPVSLLHSHKSVVSFHLRICPVAQP